MLFIGLLLMTIGLLLLAAWIIPMVEDAEDAGIVDFSKWED